MMKTRSTPQCLEPRERKVDAMVGKGLKLCLEATSVRTAATSEQNSTIFWKRLTPTFTVVRSIKVLVEGISQVSCSEVLIPLSQVSYSEVLMSRKGRTRAVWWRTWTSGSSTYDDENDLMLRELLGGMSCLANPKGVQAAAHCS